MLDVLEHVAAPRTRSAVDLVYFLKAGPFVKIGYTNSLRTRLNDLQVGCPYEQELIATLPGDRALEFKVHRLAGQYRARAEWFHFKGDLRRWVRGADNVLEQWSADAPEHTYLSFKTDKPDEFDEYLISIGRAPVEWISRPGPRITPFPACSRRR